MQTIKRNPPEIDTDIDYTNKFFNQFEFKGIMEPDNIFITEDNSFEDAKNVYVDDGQFVGRHSLQKDIEVPKDAIPYLYDLIDYLVIGDSTLYISRNKQTNNIIINLFNDDNIYTLDNITQYHIATIEHYIICFNNVDAKVFDASTPTEGWQDFDNFVDVPVVKRVVGSQVTEYPANGFTESYKEEYVWSNESHPELPDDSIHIAYQFTSYDYMIQIYQSNPTQWDASYPVGSLFIAGYDDEENPIYYRYDGNGVFTNIPPPVQTEMTLITENQKYTLKSGNFSEGTEYQTLRKINFKVLDDDIVSVANDTIVIARDGHFYVSFDTINFQKVYYPAYSGTYLKIASISKNGQYFFFVTTSGVYRCNLTATDFPWAKLTRPVEYSDKSEITIVGTNYNNAWNFLNGDTYCFITIEEDISSSTCKLHYWFSTLQFTDDTNNRYVTRITETIDKSNLIDVATYDIQLREDMRSQFRNCIGIGYDMNDIPGYVICLPVYNNSKLDTKVIYISLDENNSYKLLFNNTFFISSEETFARLVPISVAASPISSGIAGEELKNVVELTAFAQDTSDTSLSYLEWYYGTWRIGFEADATSEEPNYYVSVGTYTTTFINPYLPFKLDGGYYSDMMVYSFYEEGMTEADYVFLPYEMNGKSITSIGVREAKGTWASGDNFYLLGNDYTIYTNYMTDNEVATITYTYLVDTEFTKIPQVSYSDTELYLAFGDTLQITENNRDGTKILFNLPPKNNQSFITDITAMVNISTTEVAIFFENKIVICSKVEDENFGYRYDYYNTKLSLGVRLGDGVINTLEGSYTIFPTKRGLAVMNYQAFMATTDQTIQYITDDIKELWNKFYKESNVIKIIQWRNNLVFTNGTKDILLYYLVNQSWWRWEVPFDTQIAITDQLSLKIISRGELNIFTDEYIVNDEVKQLKYYDFSANGENIPIEWLVQSQPMHLSAPTFYKNLKQLIFQFFTDDEEISEATMLAQIKLYRKRIDLKEPSTIEFKIERLRTFVKRFNYWKINELQWGLANDSETNTPARFRLNGISIKYEIGDEVR